MFQISYYIVNSFEFACIGLLILIASIICIILHKQSKQGVSTQILKFSTLFSYSKRKLNSFFFRRQHLNKQASIKRGTRFINKK